ncbi:glycoside hydrolase family 130 protein [Novipirellula sp. SH528]|uniref:glycoside hydrolase family 130 protein n=1 Tax=Novipirellula sp. SH528 TaxID=3454466 RepID=UPI003F9FDEB6
MIARLSDSLLLSPCDIRPSQSDWEVIGVFNPAVTVIGDEMVMLARVAERPTEKRSGWTALPRWSHPGETTVDWVRDDDLHKTDARVVALKNSGDLRLTSVSHFQIFRKSIAGSDAWQFVDVLLPEVSMPEGSLEEFGIEDPRISKINNTYWITYVAVSRSGAATALMSSADLVTFQRHGIIFASENKDVVLFPERVTGDYVALHRPNPNSHFSPPQIWIARSPDLIHWGRHQPILSGVQSWEGDRVGSGTPPVLVDDGWLTLYHGSATSNIAGTVGCYAAGALLLDRDDPTRVIARSSDPIMLPTTDYETSGFVPNVVFPTGMLEVGDELQVFYGAADTSVAMTRFSKRSVLDWLVLQSGVSS